ncbi:hypothetical protein MJH12_12105, partial [bacterium]|nr:hypothetical protein [bacterium]
IGINGEAIDEYENHAKPQIFVKKGQLFVTKHKRLLSSQGRFKTLQIFNQPQFKSTYVLVEALIDSYHILEGPNDKQDVLSLKSLLSKNYSSFTLLIDGSIDRQFLCDPAVSDEIYFSLLISDRKIQRNKAKQFLLVHSFACNQWDKKYFDHSYKTILFDKDKHVLYQSTLSANFDKGLINEIQEKKGQELYLFLNCALSQKFLKQIRRLKLNIILQNPSLLVSNLSLELLSDYKIELLQKTIIKKVFLKEDKKGYLSEFSVLDHYSFHNLFQEDHHAIRL